MQLGYTTTDGKAKCLLCDWDMESNAETEKERSEEVVKEFLAHLRYIHDRRMVTSQKIDKTDRTCYHGPNWAFEMTKHPLGGCRIKRNR